MNSSFPSISASLAAACQLGDYHRVAAFLDHATVAIAESLTAAGVPRRRLRDITPAA